MGIISQGILGGFAGKVGNAIGASWKGISYIRIKPSLAFLQLALRVLKVGYRFYANKMGTFNAAISYGIQNAIIGSAPDFSVDYATALVSRWEADRRLRGQRALLEYRPDHVAGLRPEWETGLLRPEGPHKI